MLTEKKRDQVEKGKQLGCSYLIEHNGKACWVTVALQKSCSRYLAHIAIIFDENMAAEKYERYETLSFLDMESAFSFLISGSPKKIGLDDFLPLKGQKAFNPSAEEIVNALQKEDEFLKAAR